MHILERGTMEVLTRGPTRPTSVPFEVRNLDVILRPEGTRRARLLRLGRRPPDGGLVDRLWGYVAAAEADVAALETKLARRAPTDRSGGGAYVLASSDGTTYLAYAVSTTADPRDDLSIDGAYLLTVRNPRGAFAPPLGLPEHAPAQLPSTLQDRFLGRRWLAAEPPDLLDHVGMDLTLVSSDAGDPDCRPLSDEERERLRRELAAVAASDVRSSAG